MPQVPNYTSSPIYNKFCKQFTQEQADLIITAANEHRNGIHDNPGSDIFKWALLICIGHECLTRFKEYHKITILEDILKQWIKDNAELSTHDGDCDFLALACGAYDEYMPVTSK